MLGSRFVSMGLLGLVLIAVAMSVPVRAQTSTVCERALDAANDQYLDAEYEEALRLVSSCLNQKDIPAEQAVSAYRLLALIHLKRDELESARAAVVNLLGIKPTYEADPVSSPPSYVSLVSIVQRELQRTAEADTAASSEPTRTPFFRRSSTWITIGGILVGSGVATYFAMEGGSTSNGGDPPPSGPGPLPVPPGTP